MKERKKDSEVIQCFIVKTLFPKLFNTVKGMAMFVCGYLYLLLGKNVSTKSL